MALERRYINWYGRKDIGTGILINKTDGGEGTSGLKHTEEQYKKLVAAATARKGIPRSKEICDKISASKKGKPGTPKSAETRAKISASHKKRERGQAVCPHCGKEGAAPQMKQWHFDKCKRKNDDSGY